MFCSFCIEIDARTLLLSNSVALLRRFNSLWLVKQSCVVLIFASDS